MCKFFKHQGFHFSHLIYLFKTCIYYLIFIYLQVIRLVHGLLSRLMSVFPTEPTNSSVASKYPELEGLYANVGKVMKFLLLFFTPEF